MSDVLAPPKNVSPLIRGARWVALLGGIWYGHSRLQKLRRQDEPLRKVQIEKATLEHEKHLAQKDVLAKESLIQLAQAAGVKVKEQAK